jgi:arginase family enzyme
MHIELIAVPYDSAHRGRRMGAGPEHLLRAGLPDRLAEIGHQIHVRVLEAPADGWRAEIRTAFDLTRGFAAAVRDATATYLHVELDVLDPTEGRVNPFAVPGGLTRADVTWAVGAIAASLPLGAASLTFFDPASDPTGRASDAALGLGLVRAADRAPGAEAAPPIR